jgi:hypothetical protein
MPKNNKKSKAHHQVANDLSDEDNSNDAASVYSYQSDHNPGESVEDVPENSIDKFEDKLIQAIENASEKSQQTRTAALQSMSEIFMHNCLYDFLDERRVTVMDIIEKSLKRGKGQEQAIAARLSALLLIQLQGDEDIAKTLTPLLTHIVLDKSTTSEARSKSCLSLALMQFLSGEDGVGDTIPLCQTFEGIFSASYLKGDSSPSAVTQDNASLHAAALGSWALLLTLISPSDIVSLIQTKQIGSFKNIMGLLKSQHLDVRTTAGEAIALLLECGRIHDEDFLEEYIDDLVEITKLLATDSQKFRAKRDRKQQRATFRDVLHYIEEEIFPDIQIQVGAGITKDTLTIDSWTLHHQYNSICNALGSGMNFHLFENDLLRDVFSMGERLDSTQITNAKLSKSEKKAIQAASFKARTLTRGRNRDKRSAVVN